VCVACEFPLYTNSVDSETCTAVYLNVYYVWLIVIPVVVGSLYFIVLSNFASDIFFQAFIATIFPIIDVISDLIYFLSTAFYNKTLFALAIIFYLLPNIIFICLCIYHYIDQKYEVNNSNTWWLYSKIFPATSIWWLYK
jgi:hypothetical protein